MQKKSTHIETKTVVIPRCGVLISSQKNADKPVCYAAPNNNKPNPLKTSKYRLN